MGTSTSKLEEKIDQHCITPDGYCKEKKMQGAMTSFWNCGECMSHESPPTKEDANVNNDPWYHQIKILPKDDFDLNENHLTEPPYLGSSHWQVEEANSSPEASYNDSEETPILRALGDDSVTTAITTVQSSSSDLTDCNPNDNDVSKVMVSFTPKRLFHEISVVSSIEDEDDEDISLNPTSPVQLSPEKSQTDDSNALISTPYTQLCGQRSSPIRNSTGCWSEPSVVIRNGVLLRGDIEKLQRNNAPSKVSLNTLHIPDGFIKHNKQDRNQQMQRRHINTLPSFRKGHPIRLQLRESYACATSDYAVSYDPFFSMGKYTIFHQNSIGVQKRPKSYGNGLHVKMGPEYMTLQDENESIVAIMRSRHTFVPSHVIYSTRPRYDGQLPSTHRPNGVQQEQEQLYYPWALVQKQGRRMDHLVTIHFVSSDSMKKIDGIFDAQPAYTAKHGFDGSNHHSHTIVLRNQPNSNDIPCSISFRNPIQKNLFDVTIAPGIDPLLMICYFAIHSKMDVEPILSDL